MNFFIATVEDNASDPAQAGSCLIRIQGHQDKLPKADLRHAKCVFDVTNPISDKKGGPVTGLLNGSQVVGFMIDGPEGQIPWIIGTIGSEGKRNSNTGPLDYTKGDTPVAHKDKTNNRGQQLGGIDARYIPADGDKRNDANAGQLDTKSILAYAKDEAVNPYNETQCDADDGSGTFTCGQVDPSA